MIPKQFEIWTANLSPQLGTRVGKTRPVLVIQNDELNKDEHSSTLICPLTSDLVERIEYVTVHVPKGVANLNEESEILIDQIRAVDNHRLGKKMGDLPDNLAEEIKNKIMVVIGLNGHGGSQV